MTTYFNKILLPVAFLRVSDPTVQHGVTVVVVDGVVNIPPQFLGDGRPAKPCSSLEHGTHPDCLVVVSIELESLGGTYLNPDMGKVTIYIFSFKF